MQKGQTKTHEKHLIQKQRTKQTLGLEDRQTTNSKHQTCLTSTFEPEGEVYKRTSWCCKVSPVGQFERKSKLPGISPSPKVITVNSLHPWVLHLWIPLNLVQNILNKSFV
jgi:hypothetical protein